MIDGNGLVNVSSFGKRRVTFNPERGGVCFYCQDCKDFASVRKIDPQEAKRLKHHSRQYAYTCEKCQGFNVVIGTEEGIREFYTLKPSQVPPAISIVNAQEIKEISKSPEGK